jgi:hypothetical protein
MSHLCTVLKIIIIIIIIIIITCTVLSRKCYCALGPILKRRSISQPIKIRQYKTIIRPAVIYGAEGWTVTDRNGKILMTWERKILRKIYGPTEGNGQWRVNPLPALT